MPPPPTRGLAHAQTEAAGEGVVLGAHSCAALEVHGGTVFPRVVASDRAQPQREVPALEAALFQLHSGLQGRAPAAEAPGRQPQHRVVGERRGALARGQGPAGLRRERRDEDIEGKEVSGKM